MGNRVMCKLGLFDNEGKQKPEILIHLREYREVNERFIPDPRGIALTLKAW